MIPEADGCRRCDPPAPRAKTTGLGQEGQVSRARSLLEHFVEDARRHREAPDPNGGVVTSSAKHGRDTPAARRCSHQPHVIVLSLMVETYEYTLASLYILEALYALVSGQLGHRGADRVGGSDIASPLVEKAIGGQRLV